MQAASRGRSGDGVQRGVQPAGGLLEGGGRARRLRGGGRVFSVGRDFWRQF